jgi:hypothetical protein|tara:strand:- start:269 stop:460 length:192 start_codon:yes stop_codon:yes gene_type:complete
MRNDVEKLVNATALINQLLEVTKTLGDDIRMPIVECDIAIIKRARELDKEIHDRTVEKIMMED